MDSNNNAQSNQGGKNNNLMPHNKKISKDNRGYGLKQIAKMTLGSGNIDLAVELPKGEDLNEWLAVNTIEFYNDINLLSIKFELFWD